MCDISKTRRATDLKLIAQLSESKYRKTAPRAPRKPGLKSRPKFFFLN